MKTLSRYSAGCRSPNRAAVTGANGSSALGRVTVAATVTIDVKLDPSAIARVVGGTAAEAATTAARVIARRVRENIIAEDLIDTGFMRDNITVEEARPGDRPVAYVHVAGQQAVFQEFGTRGHGPVRAQYLRFKPKGSNVYVFARWVRGVRPRRFMTRAIESVTVADFIP